MTEERKIKDEYQDENGKIDREQLLDDIEQYVDGAEDDEYMAAGIIQEVKTRFAKPL